MHLPHIPQCITQNRNVNISVLNGALWENGQVHCGICKVGLFHKTPMVVCFGEINNGFKFHTRLLLNNQIITWTNVNIVSIRPLRTNCSEIWLHKLNSLPQCSKNTSNRVTANLSWKRQHFVDMSNTIHIMLFSFIHISSPTQFSRYSSYSKIDGVLHKVRDTWPQGQTVTWPRWDQFMDHVQAQKQTYCRQV